MNIRRLLLSVLALGAMIVGQAFAGPVSTGTVSYNFMGLTSDTSCVTSQQRESFTGAVTDSDDSISDASLSFSICNDPGSFAGGVFVLTVDPSDVISGTISATDLGDSIVDGIDHETVSGSFTVTAGTGVFIDSIGYSDLFLASTAETIDTGTGTGSFIIGTPEPGTMAITGLGIAVIGFRNRRRRYSSPE